MKCIAVHTVDNAGSNVQYSVGPVGTAGDVFQNGQSYQQHRR